MGLSASLTSVRHSLLLFLSSCLWRAPCETWSALLYFHGVHVLLGFFIHCSVSTFYPLSSVRKRYSEMPGGFQQGRWKGLWQSFTLSTLLCSLRPAAKRVLPPAPKRGHCLAPQRDLCQKDKSTRVKFSGPGAQDIL